MCVCVCVRVHVNVCVRADNCNRLRPCVKTALVLSVSSLLERWTTMTDLSLPLMSLAVFFSHHAPLHWRCISSECCKEHGESSACCRCFGRHQWTPHRSLCSACTQQCTLGGTSYKLMGDNKEYTKGHHTHFYKCLVQTETSQRLLDGLSWSFVSTFMILRGWIRITLLITFLDVSSLISLSIYMMDRHKIPISLFVDLIVIIH